MTRSTEVSIGSGTRRAPARALWTGVVAAGALATLAAGLLGPSSALAQQALAGAVRGTVTDKDFGVPLPQVRVTILEAFLATQTGPDGMFVLERVPPGVYTVAFSKEGYQRQVVPEVVVNAGGLAEIRTQMSLEVTELEGLVVTGEDLLGDTEVGLLDVRAEASMLQDAISAEIISKTGASDVAGALKFVVGASVAQGKYATVRGLSDRYTGTTLNGVKIPSADPRRRAVQVDIFPTGTIENVTVTKSFTPDQQGDFTGGGVDIRTRAVPDEPLATTSFGVEHNSLATGNEDFLTYEGGGVETFGIAGSDRALPDVAKRPLPASAPPSPVYGAASTPALIAQAEPWDQLVRAFTPTMGVSREAPGPNTSFSTAFGKRFDQGEGSAVGLIGALTYQHKYDYYDGGQNNNYEVADPSQPLILGEPRNDSAGLDEVLVGLLGSAVYQASQNHEYGFRLIANQSAEDEARLQTSGTEPIQVNQALHYTERTVGSGQFYGHSVWPGAALKEIRLDWHAAYNITRQDEPDVRFFLYNHSPASMTGDWIHSTTEADHTRRIYRDINEGGGQGALDLTLPFDQWTKTEGRIKTGLFYDRTDRDYNEDSFIYMDTMPQPGMIRANPNPDLVNDAVILNRTYFRPVMLAPGSLWTDVVHRPERIGLARNRCPPGTTINQASVLDCSAPNQMLWYIDPQTDTDVDYTGDQEVGALYAMGDLPLSPRVRIIGGARYESTEMLIEPFNATMTPVFPDGRIELIELTPQGNRLIVEASNAEGVAEIDEASILPSLSVVYEIQPHMNLRASWGRTLARPTFRELSPVATEEFLAGDEFVGNIDLKPSSIVNYDLRWEWFRTPGEVLAASVFYKELTDPIELISFFVAGRNFVQPINYERGEVRGAEIEARFPLGSLAKSLEGLAVGANYTILDSEVDVPEVEQASLVPFGLDEETRRLQGQPESLANANISYDLDRLGISTGLFYNVVGETLATGAAAGQNGGVPSTYLTTFRTLDFTYAQRLVKGKMDLSVSVKAKNLLHPDRITVFRSPDGQEVIETLRPTAILYGLSFNLKW
jgi:TonB-dependent receptor